MDGMNDKVLCDLSKLDLKYVNLFSENLYAKVFHSIINKNSMNQILENLCQ